MSEEVRVVVTGTGVISPIGEGSDIFWEGITNGKSGVKKIKSFDTSLFKSCYGAEVSGFKPEKYSSNENYLQLGRASQFSIAAAKMAIEESGIDSECCDKERVGIAIGTTMGEIKLEEEISEEWVANGPQRISPKKFDQYPCGNIPLNMAAYFGFWGPNIVMPTACAAGNYAIGYAYDMLKSGRADIMIAGGVDPFSRVAFTGFHRILSIAPERCMPFDLNRKGIIVGEGAGMLLIETLEHAKRRGANIIAELAGYGLSCDAHHITSPHPEGRGGVSSIHSALNCSSISADEVQYISAHGTGTGENDRVETLISKTVFGAHSSSIPMSSIKSMLGHTMGAASAIEAIACCFVVRDNIIPPTINYSEPDPQCDLDYVPNFAREQRVDIALSNAFAFGGNNASIVMKKYQGN